MLGSPFGIPLEADKLSHGGRPIRVLQGEACAKPGFMMETHVVLLTSRVPGI